MTQAPGSPSGGGPSSPAPAQQSQQNASTGVPEGPPIHATPATPPLPNSGVRPDDGTTVPGQENRDQGGSGAPTSGADQDPAAQAARNQDAAERATAAASAAASQGADDQQRAEAGLQALAGGDAAEKPNPKLETAKARVEAAGKKLVEVFNSSGIKDRLVKSPKFQQDIEAFAQEVRDGLKDQNLPEDQVEAYVVQRVQSRPFELALLIAKDPKIGEQYGLQPDDPFIKDAAQYLPELEAATKEVESAIESESPEVAEFAAGAREAIQTGDTTKMEKAAKNPKIRELMKKHPGVFWSIIIGILLAAAGTAGMATFGAAMAPGLATTMHLLSMVALPTGFISASAPLGIKFWRGVGSGMGSAGKGIGKGVDAVKERIRPSGKGEEQPKEVKVVGERVLATDAEVVEAKMAQDEAQAAEEAAAASSQPESVISPTDSAGEQTQPQSPTTPPTSGPAGPGGTTS